MRHDITGSNIRNLETGGPWWRRVQMGQGGFLYHS